MMGRRGDGVLLLVDGGGRGDGRQDHLLMMLMMLMLMFVHGRRIGAATVAVE